MNDQSSDHTGTPAGAALHREPLTLAEARALLDEARRHRDGELYELALRRGIRRNELLALRWTDIDSNSGTVAIRYTPKRGAPNSSANTPAPKTHPVRYIPLSTSCINILEERRRRQQTEHGGATERRERTGLVFASDYGTALDPVYARRQLTTLCHGAGIRPIRFPALRYTCAALLLATGSPLNVIKVLLGHTCVPVAASIVSIRLDGLEKAVAKLDTRLTSSKPWNWPTGAVRTRPPDRPACDRRDDDQPPEPIGAPIR
jgi:integrase